MDRTLLCRQLVPTPRYARQKRRRIRNFSLLPQPMLNVETLTFPCGARSVSTASTAMLNSDGTAEQQCRRGVFVWKKPPPPCESLEDNYEHATTAADPVLGRAQAWSNCRERLSKDAYIIRVILPHLSSLCVSATVLGCTEVPVVCGCRFASSQEVSCFCWRTAVSRKKKETSDGCCATHKLPTTYPSKPIYSIRTSRGREDKKRLMRS